jgi:hypothetical protein
MIERGNIVEDEDDDEYEDEAFLQLDPTRR